jgi:hypothetical protein
MRHLALVEALAVAALALSASSGLAQRTAPMPDYTTLRLGVDTLEVHVVRSGERRRTGVIVDAIDTVRSGGELRLVRAYRTIDLVLGTSLDTIIDEAARLVPRYSSRSSGRSSDALTWSNGRITGFVAEVGEPRRSIDEGGADSVFNGASVDLILRASPLADGYVVTIPTFSGAQGLTAVKARVAGSESVGGIDAWRVDANFADLPVTLWIDKVSRRLIRQVMRPADDVEIEFIRADANWTRRVASRGSEPVEIVDAPRDDRLEPGSSIVLADVSAVVIEPCAARLHF